MITTFNYLVYRASATSLARLIQRFAVNTGCRYQEVCNLRWEWETKVPEGSVFLIPEWQVKNREERLVVLNKIAHHVIEEMQGLHSKYVFTLRETI